MSVSSLAELKEYCLRQSGKPLVKVNISTEQLDDCVAEAIQYYQEFHNEGQERIFAVHQITQDDIDNKYITLPSSIFAVMNILNTSAYANSFSWMTPQYELIRDTTMDVARGAGGVSDYVITRQYLADFEAMLAPNPQFTYRQNTGKLQVFTDWDQTFRVGGFIVYEAHAIIDPTVYSRFWNNRLLKQLAAGMVMYQYGRNLTKYSTVQLPSGVTLDAASIVSMGKDMIAEAKEEIQELAEPLGFITR